MPRVYATTAQLVDYTGQDAPADADRLLRRASGKIDELLLTAVYAADAAGMPTDPDVAAALTEATCAQVEWWGETGDESGAGAVAALAGAKIGTVQLPAGADGQGIAYAPDAVSALRRAGLTSGGPIIPDGWRGPLR